MFCPRCGHPNPDSGAFCTKCGSLLPRSDGAAAPAVATGVYAGFWKRFAAFILDYIVVVVLAMAAGGIIGFFYGATSGTPEARGAEGLGAIAGVLVWWLYYALMESSSSQATLGKMALGIRVVGRQGERISFWRATGRNFAKLLSGVILMIGYLMAGFTAKKQALHDMMAGCLVVNRGATEAEIQKGIPATAMPVWAIVLIVLAAMVFPVGILAAIAIPAYQDYTVRARVAGAVQAGNRVALAVEDFHAKNNVLPRDLREAGVAEPPSHDIQRMSVDPRSGVVEVVLAASPLKGKSIRLVPRRDSDNRVVWTCGSDDIQARYLPARCRK